MEILFTTQGEETLSVDILFTSKGEENTESGYFVYFLWRINTKFEYIFCLLLKLHKH